MTTERPDGSAPAAPMPEGTFPLADAPPPVLGRPAPRRDIVTATHARRLVVLDPAATPAAHAGRAAMRRAVLGMTPLNPGDSRRPDVPARGDGRVFWALLASNGLAVVLRARDFPTAEEARLDADLLLRRASELVAHPVGAAGTGRHSLWLALDGRVVLVAGQVWRRSGRPADPSVLRAVRQRSGWGRLDA